MNWTCLVYGAPMLFVLIWWVVDARKWFKGPKVNLEHVVYGREDNVGEMKGRQEFVGGDGKKGGLGETTTGDSGSGVSAEQVYSEKRG